MSSVKLQILGNQEDEDMIGARIAALRRQKKLSQQALARQVGVSCLLYTSDAADEL